ADLQLVLRVQIREEQADSDGCTVALEVDRVERRLEGVHVERYQDAALLVEPLADAEAVTPSNERCRLAPVEVVVVLPVDPLDVGDVLEPLRRQVEDVGATSGEDGVDPDRRPDHNRLDRLRLYPRLLQRRGYRRNGVAG